MKNKPLKWFKNRNQNKKYVKIRKEALKIEIENANKSLKQRYQPSKLGVHPRACFHSHAEDKKYKHINLINTVPDYKKLKNYDYCHGTRFNTIICANGCMYICCLKRNIEKYKVADLNKISLKKAWESDSIENITKEIDVKKCWIHCKNESCNQILEEYLDGRKNKHKSFI